MNTRSSGWKVVLGVLAGVTILAGAAQAQVLTYARSFEPLSGVCYPLSLEAAPGGGVVVMDSYSITRFSSAWSPVLTVANHSPGITREPFYYAFGGAVLPDGRLLVPDVNQNRFVVFTSGGAVSDHWAAGFGPGDASYFRATPTGDFFMSFVQNGVTTVRRWDSSGALVRTWTIGESLRELAVRNGVVYLTGDVLGRLFRYDFNGNNLGTWYINAGPNVNGIGIDDAGRIYLTVVRTQVAALVVYGADGSLLQTIYTPSASQHFSSPTDVLVMGTKLYVADGSAGYGTIHEFTLTAPVPTATHTWGQLKAIYR